MAEQLKQKVIEVIQSKIKEPISDDIILGGEHHVRVKLSIQNRSFDELDNDYLAELIAESALQIAISKESANLLESLSMIS